MHFLIIDEDEQTAKNIASKALKEGAKVSLVLGDDNRFSEIIRSLLKEIDENSNPPPPPAA